MAPAMKPRTVCFCQPIFSIISESVAPFFRWSMATTWAVLLPSRGPVLSRVLAAFLVLGAFLAGVDFLVVLGFVGAPLAACAPRLALFLPLGELFFELAAFFAEAFSGATVALCSATAAVSVVSAFSVVM